VSGGTACRNRSHRPFWLVLQYRYNCSAFNGGRKTPSDYSTVRCRECDISWRTNAAYVETLEGAGQ
jgi:hypothetical protein